MIAAQLAHDIPSMLEAALALATRGFRVLPLHGVIAGACTCQKGAECGSAGKHPRFKGWESEASSAPANVGAWWRRWPAANIGLAMGGPSRVIALDVDGPEGRATLDRLEAEHGELPVTLASRSGRDDGGEHRFFRVPEEWPLDAIPNGVGRARGSAHPGIDVRAEGGQVVAPPSMHRSGRRYQWIGPAGLDTPIAPLPRWLHELLTAPRERPSVAGPGLVNATPGSSATLPASSPDREARARAYARTLDPSISGSGGHNALFIAAMKIGPGFDLDRHTATRILLEDFNPRCRPPWDPADVRRKVDQAFDEGTYSRGSLLDAPLPERPSGVRASGRGAEHDLEREAIQEEGATEAEREEQASAPLPFTWVSMAELFSPLPPVRWICSDLQITAGRPAMLAGYGSSGKTLALQALALAVATGGRIWDHYGFRVREPLKVRHVDHEQGRHATARRYQRLAVGYGISPDELADAAAHDRLAVASFPTVYLNQPTAYDAYCRAFEGVDLVIIDALRGATPGHDENDSKIRECIDVLTHVSTRAGTAFMLIHHAGKPKEQHEDRRTVLRGSSAIFDACGSVFVLHGERGEPKGMQHVKAAAEAAGGLTEDFFLVVEDVESNGDRTGGVRLSYRTREQIHAPTTPAARFEAEMQEVLAVIKANPGKSVRGIREIAGLKNSTVTAAIEELESTGRIQNRGKDRSKAYFVTAGPPKEEAAEGG